MTYHKNLELNNPHRKYVILLMNKIVLQAVLHGLCFAEKQNLYHPENKTIIVPWMQNYFTVYWEI